MGLRVLSYNVRYFGHATKGLASTRTSLRRVAGAVAGLKSLPDVLCLQEVEARSMRSALSHDRGRPALGQLSAFMAALEQALETSDRPERFDGYYFPAHQYRLGPVRLYTTGLAVVVRRGLHIDAMSSREITHRRWGRWQRLKQSRICVHIRLTKDDQAFDLFNTHLSLPAILTRRAWLEPGRMGYGQNQVKEAQALCRFVKEQSKSDRFLMMGDFNALPGSKVHEFVQSELGATDAAAAALNLSTQELRNWPTCGFLHYRMRLDHAFVGSGIKGWGFQHNPRFGDKQSYWHGLSDHVPLVGNFG